MSTKLQVRAFFFNAKTDYLPYYKNFTIKLENENSVKTLLEEIQKQNEDFSFPSKNLILKINDLIVKGDESIENIVEKLGTTLQVEPVNT